MGRRRRSFNASPMLVLTMRLGRVYDNMHSKRDRSMAYLQGVRSCTHMEYSEEEEGIQRQPSACSQHLPRSGTPTR